MACDPFYKTAKWLRLRKAALLRDLYTCTVPGCGQPAYVVDHKTARNDGGADTLANLRSLCKEHDHAIKETSTRKRANGGKAVVRGFFADGTPRDPSSDWYTGGPRAGGGSIIKS
jgi:5-methylcytosine-specific restriction endonuclease McrA